MKTYISKLNIFRKMYFLVLYIINLFPIIQIILWKKTITPSSRGCESGIMVERKLSKDLHILLQIF